MISETDLCRKAPEVVRVVMRSGGDCALAGVCNCLFAAEFWAVFGPAEVVAEAAPDFEVSGFGGSRVSICMLGLRLKVMSLDDSRLMPLTCSRKPLFGRASDSSFVSRWDLIEVSGVGSSWLEWLMISVMGSLVSVVPYRY